MIFIIIGQVFPKKDVSYSGSRSVCNEAKPSTFCSTCEILCILDTYYTQLSNTVAVSFNSQFAHSLDERAKRTTSDILNVF